MNVAIESSERDSMYFIPNCFHDHAVLKYTIICVIISYDKYNLIDVCLKRVFGLKCLIRGKEILQKYITVITLVIEEYCGYTVVLIGGSSLDLCNKTWSGGI